MNTFKIQFLANNQALVTGTDEAGENRRTVLDAYQYNNLVRANKLTEAQEDFDAAVKQHFATLTAAADTLKKATEEKLDPAFNILVSEGNNTDRTDDQYVYLSTDAAIINMIENDDTDRLVWIGDAIAIAAYEGEDDEDDVEPTTVEDLADLGVDTSVSPE